MTQYYVLKSKTDDFFQYGSLFYSHSDKQNGNQLLLIDGDSGVEKQETIVSKSLVLEISEEEFNQIKDATPNEKLEILYDIIQLNSSEKIGVVRKGTKVVSSTQEIPAILNYSMYVSGPSGERPTSLTQEDVWGSYDPETYEKLSNGMVIANTDQTCPHFEDVVPYKSVTVVCQNEQETEVNYWLEYVQGANTVSMRKQLPDNQIAIRSDYQCW